MVEGLTAQHAERAADDLYLARLIPGQIAHVVAARTPQHLEQRDKRRGHAPARLVGTAAVLVVHHHAAAARTRMTVHELQHVVQAVLGDEGVRIEQQHIVALRLAYGDVVGTGKAQVVAALYERYTVAKAVLQIVDGMVARMVVDHEYLGLDAPDGTEHALKTLLEIVAHVVTDDDDAQFHISLSVR